jgi:hypothetical protein
MLPWLRAAATSLRTPNYDLLSSRQLIVWHYFGTVLGMHAGLTGCPAGLETVLTDLHDFCLHEAKFCIKGPLSGEYHSGCTCRQAGHYVEHIIAIRAKSDIFGKD